MPDGCINELVIRLQVEIKLLLFTVSSAMIQCNLWEAFNYYMSVLRFIDFVSFFLFTIHQQLILLVTF